MKDTIVGYRNKAIHGAYTHILKPYFFRQDPEDVHDQMTRVGRELGTYTAGKFITETLFGYENEMLRQTVFGIDFKNPIGLAAGFDKNAEMTDIMPSVGFGFAEVGSVTGYPCAGNPRPRLWRLPKSESLVVWYGLKNDGCEIIAERLSKKHFLIPIGVSVAMTNCAANVNPRLAVMDFRKAFATMEPVANYITVNISCPNAKGGQPFLAPHRLDYLLDIIDEVKTSKPIFVKISPDLSDEKIFALLDVLHNHRVHGIICSNLTKNRHNSAIIDPEIPKFGGVSGRAVRDISDQMLATIRHREGDRYVLVGVGGVFSAEDAYRKIRLGASLVQMISGMIFEGPQVISEINRGLVQLLKRDGFTNISQAVGADV
ncbi:MAG: quinone-dependent dihydroorotate dehydrogenase [Patescibacteria group bacterium]|nr:quinone-dependent dihydroorotate dehydrogenase [Patescibacteria group bacterium]